MMTREQKKAERDLERMVIRVLKALMGGTFVYWMINLVKKVLTSGEMMSIMEATFDAKSAEEVYWILKQRATDKACWDFANILYDIAQLAKSIDAKISH